MELKLKCATEMEDIKYRGIQGIFYKKTQWRSLHTNYLYNTRENDILTSFKNNKKKVTFVSQEW